MKLEKKYLGTLVRWAWKLKTFDNIYQDEPKADEAGEEKVLIWRQGKYIK